MARRASPVAYRELRVSARLLLRCVMSVWNYGTFATNMWMMERDVSSLFTVLAPLVNMRVRRDSDAKLGMYRTYHRRVGKVVHG